jgi:Domain of unknown function (DUF4037)
MKRSKELFTTIIINSQSPAFTASFYLAETAACISLHDPIGRIARLKRKTARYPSALRQRIVADSLWIAEFTLHHAHKFAVQEDTYNVVGCLTRVASVLTQALFALNEVYFMTDKNAMKMITNFEVVPPAYVEKMRALLAKPGNAAPELRRTVNACEAVSAQVVELAGELYGPKFPALERDLFRNRAWCAVGRCFHRR